LTLSTACRWVNDHVEQSSPTIKPLRPVGRSNRGDYAKMGAHIHHRQGHAGNDPLSSRPE
jgi:hypothetical protein